MRCAIVDIGSNTVRMNIYDYENKFKFKQILSEKETLGLINYVVKNNMTDEGIFKLIQTLNNFKNVSDGINTDKFICFATASLRNIDNTEDVVNLIQERTCNNIEIISGENEALLDFDGIKHNFGDNLKSGIMLDMGGGSTELLGFIDSLAVRAISQPFGCLSLYKKFVCGIFPSKDEIKEIKKYVDKKIENIAWLKNYGDTVYLVGGTGRAISKLHNEIYKINKEENGYAMQIDELRCVADYLKNPKDDEIKLLIKAIPERLHTIIPGIIAYIRIFEYIGCKNIVVSSCGVREGYLQKVMNL